MLGGRSAVLRLLSGEDYMKYHESLTIQTHLICSTVTCVSHVYRTESLMCVQTLAKLLIIMSKECYFLTAINCLNITFAHTSLKREKKRKVCDLSIFHIDMSRNQSEEPRASFPLRWTTKTFFLPHPPFLCVTERAQTHAKYLLHRLIFLCLYCAIPISFFKDNYFAPINFLLPVLSCLLAWSQHLVDDITKQ